ncbi:MAG TPA: 3-phosphoserine/phosphohydroxythreonine transaminase [Lacipirellulaceae bacterium]|jgi:phosphoserine aminotransferase|nr:3-phosphoserine/phosphohydroxythreonine transaminase [Lacipirellulaceae bacterium]
MKERVLNFSAGPAVLPEPVLAEAQRDLMALPGVGASILEISHRSRTFENIIAQAESNLRQLLGIPEDYAVLFLQGGARLQFSMIPMNLMGGGRRMCNYLITGSWSKYAAQEAVKFGEAKVIWDGKATNYDRLPENSDLNVDPKAAFLYYASNETIQGVQFRDEPQTGEVPLVCDSSSDFLSRPIDIAKYGLYYACAQKNAGPAGLTVVIIRKDLLPRSSETLPGYLNFHTHAEAQSLWNTAPTFPIYILMLVTKWLIHQVGGLGKMETLNRSKSKLLYDVIDTSSGFYTGHSQPQWRSMMNVSFRLPNEELTKKFVEGAEKQRMTDLKGHRSVGGIRASLYNAMPVEGVETLRNYMVEFRNQNSK